MLGQLGGEVVTRELDVDEVHGEAELPEGEQPVPVGVREAPDLGEHGVGEAGLHHQGLGFAPGQPPVLWGGGGEELRPPDDDKFQNK